MKVYKVLTQAEWERAQQRACDPGAPIDVRDGYIHLSTKAQLSETLRLHFKGQEPLTLLAFEADELPELRWEPSRGGDLFPHLYAPLEVHKATQRWTLMCDPLGVPTPPWVG